MKIEEPKIPANLPSRNFHDILYEEELELEGYEVHHSMFEEEAYDRRG